MTFAATPLVLTPFVPFRASWCSADLRTKILDFGVFDSNGILILRGGILKSAWICPPDVLSQRISAGIILAGRLDIRPNSWSRFWEFKKRVWQNLHLFGGPECLNKWFGPLRCILSKIETRDLRHETTKETRGAAAERAEPGTVPQHSFIGWSNKHFNNLHFRMSLETNK